MQFKGQSKCKSFMHFIQSTKKGGGDRLSSCKVTKNRASAPNLNRDKLVVQLSVRCLEVLLQRAREAVCHQRKRGHSLRHSSQKFVAAACGLSTVALKIISH